MDSEEEAVPVHNELLYSRLSIEFSQRVSFTKNVQKLNHDPAQFIDTLTDFS